jgi:hypothetical protein
MAKKPKPKPPKVKSETKKKTDQPLTPIQRFDVAMEDAGLVWTLRGIPDPSGGITIRLFVYDAEEVASPTVPIEE